MLPAGRCRPRPVAAARLRPSPDRLDPGQERLAGLLGDHLTEERSEELDLAGERIAGTGRADPGRFGQDRRVQPRLPRPRGIESLFTGAWSRAAGHGQIVACPAVRQGCGRVPVTGADPDRVQADALTSRRRRSRKRRSTALPTRSAARR